MEQTSERLYTRQFLQIWASNFFTITSLSMFFIFPLFVMDRGGNKADIGIFMGVATLASVFSRPLLSSLIDKIGRKKCYIGATTMNTIACASYLLLKGQLNDFYILLIFIRILNGIGIGLAISTGLTFISDIIPPKRLNEGVGIFGTSGLIAGALGPAIAEPIMRMLGYPTFFLAAAGLNLLAMALQIFNKDAYMSQKSKTAANVTFFEVLRKKKTIGVAILSMFFGFGFATQGTFVAPYAAHLKLTNISIFFIVYSLVAVLIRLFGSKIADRFGEEKILPWAFIVTAVGFLSLIFVETSWGLIIPGMLAGAGHGFVFPCLNTLALRGEPANARGTVSGIFTGAMDGGVFLGSVMLGYIAEWFGFVPLFITTFVCIAMGGVLFIAFIRKIVIVNTDRLIA